MTLPIVLFLSLAPTVMSQIHASGQNESRNFISTDGAFRFEYPGSLVFCKRDPHQPSLWTPTEACAAYTPVCSDFSGNSSGTLVCVATPAALKKGTNLQAAAFSVNELSDATNEKECAALTEPAYYERGSDETINGVRFKVWSGIGVAAGNQGNAYVYRTFQGGKCYELDIRISSFSIGGIDPGTVKEFDLNGVRSSLVSVLRSFRFLHK